MKNQLLFLFCIVTLGLFGQNWLPIDTAKDYNYTLNGEDLIMRTISTTAINDTTFFETILDTCHTCNYFYSIKKPDFLGFYMLNDNDSIFTFVGRETFVLKPLLQPGESWLYNNIDSAKINSVEERLFDGINDSVKVVTINNSDTLILSKSFGIIEFPEKLRSNQHRQIGIEDVYGEQEIDFWDIYNFNVGDIFQYHYSHSHSDGPYDIEYYQITILDKEIGIDYYQYEVNKKSHDVLVGTYSDFNTTLTFNETNNLLYNHTGSWFPEQNNIAPNPSILSKFHQRINQSEIQVKFDAKARVHSNIISNSWDCLSLVNDSLVYSNSSGCEVDIIYVPGLGNTKFYEHSFETSKSLTLTAHNIGNGNVGDFKPTSYYTSTKELMEINEIISFSPNPSNGVLQIELKQNAEVYLQLYNVLGQLILDKSIKHNSTLSIKNISPGVYLIHACTMNNECGVSRLIIK
jgi:hypothetical protein